MSKDWIGRLVFVAVMLLCLPGSFVSSPITIATLDPAAELSHGGFYAPNKYNDLRFRTLHLPGHPILQLADVAGYDGPYPRVVDYRGTPGATFLAVDGAPGHTMSFTLDAEGRAEVDFRAFGHLSLLRLGYAGLFAMLAMLATTLVPWRRTVTALRARLGFAAAAAILGLQYALVFPGLFNHDLVLNAVNSDWFTAWYSALYLAYNYLFDFTGFDFIQLPSVLLSLAIVLLVDQHVRPRWPGRLVLLLMLAFNPFLFATTFASQRYFTAGLFALLGLTLLFCARRPAQDGRLTTWFVALASLAAAGLMRPEYWLFWIIGLAYGALVLLRRAPRRLALLRNTVACAALAFGMVNFGLPLLHRIDPGVMNGRYQMTLLTDFAAPYACAGDAEMIAVYERFGPAARLCDLGGEKFYWEYVSPTGNDRIAAAAIALRALFLDRLFADPMPQVERVVTRFVATLTQDVFQVFNKYDLKDRPAPSPHEANADAMGIVHDSPALRPLHDALIAMVREIGNPRYLLLALCFAFVLLSAPVLFVLRRPLAATISLAVIAIALLSIVLSPVANWAYILMVPLWATYTLPLARLERD